MSFFFLPDVISPIQFWVGTVTAWLAEARNGGGEAFGLVLLLVMAVAIPVAVWWEVYRTLSVWLRAHQNSGSRR
jgi:hypothetical protein